ncbi:MAG TPA: oxidoreductase [Lentisphaeria bacterium]|nr:MAG: oxidoreductase [Lentisphaerae bacterium GWF2_50_93]HCE46107.1 oxidoreductase [Lentisphaeria bacterium]
MKEVRFGIIGIGNMGGPHMGFVKETPGAKLTAICDIDREKADKNAEKAGVKAYYNSSDLIKSGDVDAVIIATPHFDHTTIAIEAFKNGIHVLTEKPVAVHKADAVRMIEAHNKRKDLLFGIMFQQRTDGMYMKLKELLSSGEFGEVRRINWIITNWFRSQRYYDSGGWRATWRGEGGGVLFNQCPHNLDLFQWFFGMPSKVRAFCDLGKYHKIEVEDNVTAYCEYPNGASAVFITTTGDAPGTNRLEITCERGRVLVENGKILFNRLEVPLSKYCMTTDKQFEGPACWNVDIPYRAQGATHQRIIEAFTKAALHGDKLIVRGEEGLNSIELANAMILSSMKGKTVDLPLNAAEYAKLLNGLIKTSKYKKEVKKGDADFAASFNKK